MKVKVEFITARLDGKLLMVEAIQNCYTEVQVIVNKNTLDDKSTEILRENSYFIREYKDTFNIGSYEAKDACGIYGNLVVAIESKIIDFE